MIRPGEIYNADFGPAGPYPIIVVSRKDLNRGNYLLAVVCTSARFAIRMMSAWRMGATKGNFNSMPRRIT